VPSRRRLMLTSQRTLDAALPERGGVRAHAPAAVGVSPLVPRKGHGPRSPTNSAATPESAQRWAKERRPQRDSNLYLDRTVSPICRRVSRG
jgi:hypothetical protein